MVSEDLTCQFGECRRGYLFVCWCRVLVVVLGFGSSTLFGYGSSFRGVGAFYTLFDGSWCFAFLGGSFFGGWCFAFLGGSFFGGWCFAFLGGSFFGGWYSAFLGGSFFGGWYFAFLGGSFFGG